MTAGERTPLHGRVAWITGASRGIGAAIGRALAREGATVVLGARTVDSLLRVEESIVAKGGRAASRPLDLADAQSIAAFASSTESEFGPPAILVNNAATATFRDADKLTVEEFDRMMAVNVRGPWLLCRAALPGLIACGSGHIVNVSSLAGAHAMRMGSGYCASKAALNMLSDCLMLELRERGVRVTLVCPGSVDTRFHTDSHPGMHARDQSWMLDPEDVAACVVSALTLPSHAMLSRLEVRPTVVVKN